MGRDINGVHILGLQALRQLFRARGCRDSPWRADPFRVVVHRSAGVVANVYQECLLSMLSLGLRRPVCPSSSTRRFVTTTWDRIHGGWPH